MKNLIRSIVILCLLAAAATWGWHHYTVGRWVEQTDNATIRADITALSSKIGGEVIEVAVKENQQVHKGDVLVRIDARDYSARLANAKAQLAAAQAALVVNSRNQAMQAAMVEQATASLTAAQAEKNRSKQDYDRASALVKDGVATVARLDVANSSLSSANANVSKGAAGVKAARSQIGTLSAERERALAQVQAAQAAVELAQLDLEATTIRSPIDANVGDLSVKLGERIAPSQRLLSLVGNNEVWVIANFKETQLTRFAIGQPAEVKVDAYPKTILAGKIQSLSPASGAEFSLLPPENATGNFTKIVQRVPVKITLAVPAELAGKLRSGMNVEVTVDTRGDQTAVAQ